MPKIVNPVNRDQIMAILEETGVCEIDAAVCANVAPKTIFAIVREGRMPIRRRTLAALATFVERNRDAKCRSDLRLSA